MKKNKITIVGAGLAGCFMTLLLAKRGYKVELYERASKEEVDNPISNRSFNLTFQGYGTDVLKEAGIWDVIKPVLIPIEGSMTQVKNDTKPIFSRLDKKIPYYTATRTHLVKKMVGELLKHPLVTVHFDTALIAIDRYAKTITIQNTKTQKITTVACDVVFGADGVNSQVRPYIQQGQQAHHAQEYEDWAYKQITIQEKTAKQFDWKKDHSYTWTRKHCALTAYPTIEKTFNSILMLPKKEFKKLQSEEAIKEFFTENFPDLLPALSDITASLLINPEGNFVTIYTDPWYYKDFLVLLGDAAHGFLPFYGQGMSTGFGDCMEMARLIDTYGTDWGKIFPLYQQTRKENTDALARLSKAAFNRYRRSKKADYSAVYDKFDTILYTISKKFSPPEYINVAYDSSKTAAYVHKHKRQRKIAAFLGVPILVRAVTIGVGMYEVITDLRYRFSVVSFQNLVHGSPVIRLKKQTN